MADKLNDDEIVAELKRFGDIVKVPIDRKRRPILIKKLNHYYAKENPPPKRGKSGSRQSKARPAPAAEFSDDSQDETETADSFSRTSNHRNKSLNNYGRNDSPSKRNRQTDIRAFTRNSRSRDNLERGGKRKDYSIGPSSSHVEIYPDEFSDNDTADESVYVEEQSIGVNTSLNYDDTFNDEEVSPNISFTVRRRPEVRSNSKKQSSLMRNVYVARARQGDKDETDLQGSNDHVISKSILIIMTVFFAVLGLSYIYIRRDIFLPTEAAITGSDLKAQADGKTAYSKDNVTEALRTIAEWFKDLASRKGKFELGYIEETDVRMSKDEALRKCKSKTLVELCFKLILEHPEWDILVFDRKGADASAVEDVDYLESKYGDLSLVMRTYLALKKHGKGQEFAWGFVPIMLTYLALKKVLDGFALLLFCIGVCILGIFYLRWQNKKKEQEQFKVYEMVEKIIDILKENSELAERKNDPKNFPPYLAVQHVRDQLISIARRKQMKQLWDEAVKFIETNESRIRVDTQVIHGEEFTVWRWLPAVPNGHKMWQGQAFGETSQSSVNLLPYGPTPCLKVRNMFDPNVEQTTDDWHLDIEENILQKCKEVDGILHIFVDRNSREGCVYIKCDSCQKAYETYKALHGCWFDGRLVTVKYLRLEHYHDRFPDSRNRKYPLKPSDDEMTSVAKPYHRSALEMT